MVVEKEEVVVPESVVPMKNGDTQVPMSTKEIQSVLEFHINFSSINTTQTFHAIPSQAIQYEVIIAPQMDEGSKNGVFLLANIGIGND